MNKAFKSYLLYGSFLSDYVGAWTRGGVSADSRGYVVVNELRGSLLTPCIQICFSCTKR